MIDLIGCKSFGVSLDIDGMEKLVLDGGPPNSVGYGTLKCPYDISSIVQGVGNGLIDGTAIGFFYNFIKGNSCGFKSRLRTALAKSPCLGANLALVSLGHILSRAAYFKYSGEPHHGDIIPYQIHCAAIGGAVGFANYGLRVASLAALTTAGLVSWSLFNEVHKTRYGSSICKTNTYTYPHYRRPHHEDDDIPWPEALLYDSSLPED